MLTILTGIFSLVAPPLDGLPVTALVLELRS